MIFLCVTLCKKKERLGLKIRRVDVEFASWKRLSSYMHARRIASGIHRITSSSNLIASFVFRTKRKIRRESTAFSTCISTDCFLINNGNRTELSIIIRVINKIGRPRSGRPNCSSQVWLQTELEDTKSCYKIVKTMTKFEKENRHRLYVFSWKKLLTWWNAWQRTHMTRFVH